MAEILVHAKGRGQMGDGDYDPGDIVDIREDGAYWGPRESLQAHLANGGTAENWRGTFILVKVPGVTVEQVEAFGVNQSEGIFRKVWRAELENAPQDFKREIEQAGEWTTTIARAKQFFRNKLTGGRLP